MSRALQQHKATVAALGCILCLHCLAIEGTPAELHHPRHGTGMGQRASDWDVIPLCPEHHRGNSGIHGLGTKGFVKRWGVTEADLLLEVAIRIGRALPVKTAGDCVTCDCCGGPYCGDCHAHFADCACPGPRQDDQYDYFDHGGVLWAIAKGE